jgi:hypothetical protein
MASSKRRRNKKLHHRRRRRLSSSAGTRGNVASRGSSRSAPPPSEADQMGVFIGGAELGQPEPDLSALRSMAGRLPFESAMLHVAVLLCRLGPRLDDPPRQRELAKQFYASRPELLVAYERVLASNPRRVIFSPQPLMFLMRLLMEHARHEPMREMSDDEVRLLQDVVLGAHSAMEVTLDAMGLPSRDALLAYELQAATFFRRAQYLEEMARHHEFVRLATDDKRLMDSWNRVPVTEWLAEYGITTEEQWDLGFSLSAITHAFDEPVTPLVFAAHIDELLTRIGQPETPRDVPVIAAARSQFNAQFGVFGGGDETLPWEVRPFTTTPFLRLTNGDLLLLSPTWLLSWLGEGFHYRVLRRAQQAGSATSEKYLRFSGEITELYALDLATAATSEPDVVIGEQPYGPNNSERTSDVAIVSGTDLVLFEIHARRVSANAAVGGSAAEATLEVSRLLVEKADQLGPCIGALLSGDAKLPRVSISQIERIWPIVVSVGHVLQTHNLWQYVRESMDETKAKPLADSRVQPLQLLDISDYEKLLGLVEAGENLPRMLAHKAHGLYRDRDFAAWLHSPGAPSDEPRLSVLKQRWEQMTDRLVRASTAAAEATSTDADTKSRAASAVCDSIRP